LRIAWPGAQTKELERFVKPPVPLRTVFGVSPADCEALVSTERDALELSASEDELLPASDRDASELAGSEDELVPPSGRDASGLAGCEELELEREVAVWAA
jgi:hypothetical protein